MDRWACVDVPALPLQLLLRRELGWHDLPVAVVDEDRPQGTILQVNERARRARVLPGRRYAEGLSLAAGLRAGVVAAAEIAAAQEEITARLRAHGPDVEPGAGEPGVFWLDATGLEGVAPSLRVWAQGIVADLARRGLAASVAVGFDRFGSFALARAGRGVSVPESPAQERRLTDCVPLERLGLDPALRDALHRLGIDDVGAFRRLPAGGVRERFGTEAQRLHRLARGVLPAPLAPAKPERPARARHDLEPGQHGLDTTALLFLVRRKLAGLEAMLAEEGKAIAGLRLRLQLEKRPPREEEVRPAEPTLDTVQLTDLLRLRLESLRLDAEVEGFELHAEAVPARAKQRALFEAARRRDLDAGARALARVRAELGAGAVVQAELREAHLPEGRFRWRPLSRLREAEPRAPRLTCLMRRMLARPRLLAHQQSGMGGWLPAGFGGGPVEAMWGPYVVSGGWWHREQHREYHFAQTRRGDLLWLYLDRRRRVWLLQGRVE